MYALLGAGFVVLCIALVAMDFEDYEKKNGTYGGKKYDKFSEVSESNG